MTTLQTILLTPAIWCLKAVLFIVFLGCVVLAFCTSFAEDK